MVRVGQEFELEGIHLKIVDAETFFDPANKRMVLVHYRLKDGKFVSTKSPFFMRANGNVTVEAEKIMRDYKERMDQLKGIPVKF